MKMIIRSIAVFLVMFMVHTGIVYAGSPYKQGMRFQMRYDAVVCIINDSNAAHDYERYVGMFEFMLANIGDAVLADRIGSDPELARAVLKGRDTLLEEINRRHPDSECRTMISREGRGITRFQYEREIGLVEAGNGLWIRLHEAMPVERWVPERSEWQSLRQPNDTVVFFDTTTLEEDNPGPLAPQTIQAVQAQLYEMYAYDLDSVGTGTLEAVADGKWGPKTQRALERVGPKGENVLTPRLVYSLFYGTKRQRTDWLALWYWAGSYAAVPQRATTRTEAAARAMSACPSRKCLVASIPSSSYIAFAKCQVSGRRMVLGVMSSTNAADAEDRFWQSAHREHGRDIRCDRPTVFGGEVPTGAVR